MRRDEEEDEWREALLDEDEESLECGVGIKLALRSKVSLRSAKLSLRSAKSEGECIALYGV